MPYKFVGVSSVASSTSGNLTLTEPAGVQDGDLLVAIISYRSNAAFSDPSGWTNITSQNSGNTTANSTGSIGSGRMSYIVRDGTPSLTFTRTLGDVALGRIIAYRGVWSGGAPLVTSTSTTLGTAATAVNVTGLTTSNAEDLIIFARCGARNGSTTAFRATDPGTSSGTNSAQTADPIIGTWQERADSGTTAGADCSLTIADAVRGTAGATGNLLCTASSSARHVVLAAAFRTEPIKAFTIDDYELPAPTLGTPTIALGTRFDFTIPDFTMATPTLGTPAISVVQVGNYSISFSVRRQ